MQNNPSQNINVTNYRRSNEPVQFIESLTLDQKIIIAEIKRFQEWYEGSAEFRDQCRTSQLSSFWLNRLMNLGVRREVIEVMSTLYSSPKIHPIFEVLNNVEESHQHLLEEIDQKVSNQILRLHFKLTLLKNRSLIKHQNWTLNKFNGDSPYFTWRQRRILSIQSELGFYGTSIDHPTFAIELAVGCTVGCTFCAYDAQKLESIFDFNNNHNLDLFKAVARSLQLILGDGCGGGMLYYATEPNDNPDYINFLETYYQITGYKLCTSTARYNIDWLEDLIKFYSFPEPTFWPRVSVLSPHIMEKMHRHFSPLEFIYPSILAQSIEIEDERAKVPGGREKFGMKVLSQVKDARQYTSADQVDYSLIPQGSIACVTGFRINMVQKTITLTSPCYTSYKWSHGYRNFGTVSFSTPDSVYPAFIDLINRFIPNSTDNHLIFSWRDDLDFRLFEDGFELVSPYLFHSFRGSEFYKAIGLIYSKHRQLLFQEMRDKITANVPGSSILTASFLLKRFFDAGLINEAVYYDPSTT
ncbi:radical SAM family RiPP maturation amino acid epimerase [Synechococcus sp. MEDNS5]|uniref:hypothetical protein n=1 Tax=Synechococcus sp. MEDNS5 TaxID=1442554 RepID=UPI0016493B92|nr:hypothetical protein [Synechococcus sp. MEDNS5]QNJ06883.1 radical SAM family RiPP maturation amino acid epimerase [Synechococcus sp. MEDNS5]